MRHPSVVLSHSRVAPLHEPCRITARRWPRRYNPRLSLRSAPFFRRSTMEGIDRLMSPTDRGGNQGGAAAAGQRATQSRGGRGFASMDPEKQRAIASKGGKASHEQGTGHEFTPEEAA